MRNIWKNLNPRKALVANTWPDVPSPSTTNDAAIVITSEMGQWGAIVGVQCKRNCRLTYNTEWSFEESKAAYAALVSGPTS